MKRLTSLTLLVAALMVKAQVPEVYTNIEIDEENNLIYKHGENNIRALSSQLYKLTDFIDGISGGENGLHFDFNMPEFKGIMYYGLINYNDSKHPLPVYFKSFVPIESGKTSVDIKNRLGGRYDMINWEQDQAGTLGYRIINAEGEMLYEGRVSFKGVGPFEVGNTITEGPFVDLITHKSAVISLDTYLPAAIEVFVNGKSYKSKKKTKHHELLIDNLTADTNYDYSIELEGILQKYAFRTAPKPGSRSKFSFAYASDSRNGPGGGERDMYGANFYIMKKIMSLANQQGAAFVQFTGDLITGYLTTTEETDLQYANWKRSIEPWAHYLPVYEGFGNHEAVNLRFPIENSYFGISVDKFPFQTQSGEFVFAKNFVNPLNGPDTEDNAIYDPDKSKVDFPSYKENVYHYSYDNVAIICLNSNYWYAPSLVSFPNTSGGLHGYIMDNQLKWLKSTLSNYENDRNIDHIFVTLHTPAFPNGGHVHDDMWYNGNNQFRPRVAGKPVHKGILERRDEFLDLIVNQSEKVVGLLTGDEHNYCRTVISPEMQIYPEQGYFGERIELSRTIYQINNGAAGAPYYAQQKTPWTNQTYSFTTQNALVFIHIDGKNVELQVLNPDTLEEIEKFKLRQ